MLINADHPEECRAVVLEDGKIEDLIVEHASHEKIKGNIYLGVINRVEPAIEAAFVDIGGKKFGFMPFKDVRKESYLQTGEKKARVRIQDVLVRGQKILVQVAKEGRDMKGPSLTNEISLPGRFVVLMIGQQATAISRKIEDEDERKKLREIITGFNLPENMGVIIRTAGVGRTKVELQKDLQTLIKIWETIEETIKNPQTEGPSLAYREPSQVVRVLRDHFTADTSQIIVDNSDAYKELKEFVKLVMPRMHRRIRMHQETQPLFSQYKVEEQIEAIYNRRVDLPSGGSIVFDSGEAMVSIDVNSGKTTSASQLEETATNTNLEAASEIARQLRLRDLGGLVVIDFIDMFQKKNKSQVERLLKASTKVDKARINISRISKFGLLEMSRQRMSPPVKEGVFEACPNCEGAGHVKSVGAMALLVMRKLREGIAGGGVSVIQGTIAPEVVEYLLNNKMDHLQKLKDGQNVKVVFKSQAGLKPADFLFTVLERHKAQAEAAPVETKPRTSIRSRTNSRSRSNSRSRTNTKAKQVNENEVSNKEKVAEEVSLEIKDEVIKKDATNKDDQSEKETKDRPRNKRPQRRRYTRRSGTSRPRSRQGQSSDKEQTGAAPESSAEGSSPSAPDNVSVGATVEIISSPKHPSLRIVPANDEGASADMAIKSVSEPKDPPTKVVPTNITPVKETSGAEDTSPPKTEKH